MPVPKFERDVTVPTKTLYIPCADPILPTKVFCLLGVTLHIRNVKKVVDILVKFTLAPLIPQKAPFKVGLEPFKDHTNHCMEVLLLVIAHTFHFIKITFSFIRSNTIFYIHVLSVAPKVPAPSSLFVDLLYVPKHPPGMLLSSCSPLENA